MNRRLSLGWLLGIVLHSSTTLAAPPSRDVIPPHALSEIRAPYPTGAHGNADVVLDVWVDSDGQVVKAELFIGSEPFAQAAIDAARSWRFEPAWRGTTPVAAKVRIAVRFRDPSLVEEPDREDAPEDEAAPAVGDAKRIEVRVRGEKRRDRYTLDRHDTDVLPGAFGDPLRAIDVLPGVTPVVSGAPYVFIRGAPPGNVGYYLDGIPIPWVFHAGLGNSVVSPTLIDRVQLYPIAPPLHLDSTVGAAVEMTSAEPRANLHGEAEARLVDAGGAIESPIGAELATVLAGGRYSYAGPILSAVSDVNVAYWDYQFRARHAITPRSRAQLVVFGSRDYLAEEEAGVERSIVDSSFWRSELSVAGRFRDGGSAKQSLVLGTDELGLRWEELLFRTRSQLVQLRSELVSRPGAQVQVRGGIGASRQRHELGAVTGDSDPIAADITQRLFPDRRTLTLSGWSELSIRATDDINLTPGIGFDLYDFDVRRDSDRLTPPLPAGGSAAHATEFGVRPRIVASFDIGSARIVHVLALVHQPPSFAVPGVPASSSSPKLQRGIQYSAGVEAPLSSEVVGSITLFDSIAFDLTDPFGRGRSISLYDEREPLVRTLDSRSTGWTIGAEAFLHSSLKHRFGWLLSCTLSRTARTTPFSRAERAELEDPRSYRDVEQYLAAFDRRFVLNAVANYRLGTNVILGARFSAQDGVPTERALVPHRDDVFLRLDLRAERRWSLGRESWWSLYAELLNALFEKEEIGGETIGPVTAPNAGARLVW